MSKRFRAQKIPGDPTTTHNIARPSEEQDMAILKEVLSRNIMVLTGNRVRFIPVLEAAYEAVLERALQGDYRAFDWLVTRVDKLNALVPRQSSENQGREAADYLFRELVGMRERLTTDESNSEKDPKRSDPPIGA